MSDQHAALADRVAVVNRDGDRQSGTATARRFAAAGASLVLVDHQDERTGVSSRTSQSRVSQVELLLWICATATRPMRAVAEIAARHGKVDVLVNNDGALLVSVLDELTLALGRDA